MITYLLVVFPYGSYQEAKGTMNTLAITGKYERVVDDNMPVYLKGGIQYQVFCIDHNRFKLPEAAVKNMVTSLEKKGLNTIDVLTENPSEWLKKNGYATEVLDEKFL